VFIVLVTFLIVVALGAIGYFVYPLFVPEGGTEEMVTAPPPPVTLPEASGPSEAPTGAPLEAGVPAEVPMPDPFQGIQGLLSHASLFRVTPDTTTELILTAPTLASFKGGLSSGSVATPLFTEVVVKMPSGAIFPFSSLAPLIAPTFFTSARLASFSDDATYFTYAASNGTWLGIVVPLKPGAPIGPVQDGMSALQGDPDLANFFLEDPGERGVWVDGNVRGKPASQVSFANPGALFSYAWLDRNLLLTTNLTAASEAATRLGF
jgi:hypothetical protein